VGPSFSAFSENSTGNFIWRNFRPFFPGRRKVILPPAGHEEFAEPFSFPFPPSSYCGGFLRRRDFQLAPTEMALLPSPDPPFFPTMIPYVPPRCLARSPSIFPFFLRFCSLDPELRSTPFSWFTLGLDSISLPHSSPFFLPVASPVLLT